jgi:endonuclease/exonuclease/phosphatase family metal-dependent hydrolase
MEGPNTEDSKKFTARVPSDHFPVMIEVEVEK